MFLSLEIKLPLVSGWDTAETVVAAAAGVGELSINIAEGVSGVGARIGSFSKKVGTLLKAFAMCLGIDSGDEPDQTPAIDRIIEELDEPDQTLAIDGSIDEHDEPDQILAIGGSIDEPDHIRAIDRSIEDGN